MDVKARVEPVLAQRMDDEGVFEMGRFMGNRNQGHGMSILKNLLRNPRAFCSMASTEKPGGLSVFLHILRALWGGEIVAVLAYLGVSKRRCR